MTKRILIIFNIVLFLTESVMAVNPLLNFPRPGDEVIFHQFEKEPEWIGSLSPDISKVKIKRGEIMRISNGLTNDSVRNICITRGREIKTFGIADDSLHLLSEYKPGFSRVYPSGVFLSPDSLPWINADIRSVGRIDNLDEYSSSGCMTIGYFTNLKIIIDNDTLHNVECIRAETDEILSFYRNGNLRHKRVSRYWFAPGYRYPILINSEDSLLSMSDEPVDNTSIWEYSLPDEQGEMTENDPLNEYMRDMLTYNSDDGNIGNAADEKGGSNDDENRFPSIPAENGILRIKSPFGSDGITSVMITDLSGRIYLSERHNRGIPVFETDISVFPAGVYILIVSSDNESFIRKFVSG